VARTRTYWTDQQGAGDYQAAEDFLTFTYEPEAARAIVDRLRVAGVVYRLPAEVLRVAGSPVLAESSIHVVKALDEVREGKLLTPVLIVRGTAGSRLTFALADGYFRICAGIYLDEAALIPCRLVSKEPAKPAS